MLSKVHRDVGRIHEEDEGTSSAQGSASTSFCPPVNRHELSVGSTPASCTAATSRACRESDSRIAVFTLILCCVKQSCSSSTVLYTAPENNVTLHTRFKVLCIPAEGCRFKVVSIPAEGCSNHRLCSTRSIPFSSTNASRPGTAQRMPSLLSLRIVALATTRKKPAGSRGSCMCRSRPSCSHKQSSCPHFTIPPPAGLGTAGTKSVRTHRA
jgi:hypothetical protein